MTFFFANPWGFLALLGIPAVILIHLLRRKSRQVVVSTLFLVEQALPSSEGGRKVRMLRNSLPLWVQILAVAALAWLLAQPRWIDSTSTQTVVTVFDDSASMSAFRKEALESAGRELARLDAASARTQWIFLRSDASRLASGPDLAVALKDVDRNWRPDQGTHDTAEAFRLARTLAGQKGAVVYLTDRPQAGDGAAGVSWIACGAPIDNAGFLGVEVQDGRWSVLLKNFSGKSRDVRWRIAGEKEWRTQTLGADSLAEVSGEWPANATKLTLETEEDRFIFDNKLPVVRPQEKGLSVWAGAHEGYDQLFRQIERISDPATPGVAGKSDIVLGVYNPLSPQRQEGAGMIFVEDIGSQQKPLPGMIIAENHPLIEGLNWQGLIARDSLGVPFREGDSALLWQGERPLIFVHTQDGKPQLVFNFDIRKSNATRLPAFALLIHRFFSSVRDAKVAYEAANVETQQAVSVAGVGAVQAPAEPDFFSAKAADGVVLFDGAAHFADSRESDFRLAGVSKSAEAAVEAIRARHANGEKLDPVWAAVLVALMLWNWLLTGAPTRPQAAG